MKKLEGKAAVVTGASRGIGASIEERLAKMMTAKPIFDVKRMVNGGFKVLVDA